LGASLRSRASTRVPTLRALPVLEGPSPESHRPLTSPVAPHGTIEQAPTPPTATDIVACDRAEPNPDDACDATLVTVGTRRENRKLG